VKSNIKTFTGEALGVAHDMFANHARDDAYKILILITDGK
jgi:Mg-chelatase subunit ChlD